MCWIRNTIEHNKIKHIGHKSFSIFTPEIRACCIYFHNRCPWNLPSYRCSQFFTICQRRLDYFHKSFIFTLRDILLLRRLYTSLYVSGTIIWTHLRLRGIFFRLNTEYVKFSNVPKRNNYFEHYVLILFTFKF